jgi:hypothetical protein
MTALLAQRLLSDLCSFRVGNLIGELTDYGTAIIRGRNLLRVRQSHPTVMSSLLDIALESGFSTRNVG